MYLVFQRHNQMLLLNDRNWSYKDISVIALTAIFELENRNLNLVSPDKLSYFD